MARIYRKTIWGSPGISSRHFGAVIFSSVTSSQVNNVKLVLRNQSNVWRNLTRGIQRGQYGCNYFVLSSSNNTVRKFCQCLHSNMKFKTLQQTQITPTGTQQCGKVCKGISTISYGNIRLKNY